MTPEMLDRLRLACAARGLRAVGSELGYSAATLSLVLRGVYMASTDRIEARVRSALTPEPDWLKALRAEAESTSQARAAMRLGVSEATVSQVLSGTYKAATTRIERRVRGELMGAMVECPVMWEVSTKLCQTVQERPEGMTGNPQYLQARSACRGIGPFAKRGPCPHFNGGGKAAAAPAPKATSTTPNPAPKEE